MLMQSCTVHDNIKERKRSMLPLLSQRTLGQSGGLSRRCTVSNAVTVLRAYWERQERQRELGDPGLGEAGRRGVERGIGAVMVIAVSAQDGTFLQWPQGRLLRLGCPPGCI